MKPRTTRERLNRIRREATLLAALGVCVYIVGGYLYVRNLLAFGYAPIKFGYSLPERIIPRLRPEALPMAAAGIITVACAAIAINFSGRCQHCRALLGRAFRCSGGPWSIGAKLRYCPYCAVSLDIARDTEPTANAVHHETKPN